jgi:hypothetical protein
VLGRDTAAADWYRSQAHLDHLVHSAPMIELLLET